jgi:hypothetical protein
MRSSSGITGVRPKDRIIQISGERPAAPLEGCPTLTTSAQALCDHIVVTRPLRARRKLGSDPGACNDGDSKKGRKLKSIAIYYSLLIDVKPKASLHTRQGLPNSSGVDCGRARITKRSCLPTGLWFLSTMREKIGLTIICNRLYARPRREILDRAAAADSG